VRAGLGRPSKTLPSKYLYDAVGSALFEAITELPEYGLTRAEERILSRNAAAIVRGLPRGIAVAELGAGSGRKTLPLLDAVVARQPEVSYTAIDLSPTALASCARLLGTRPRVGLRSIEASYLDGLDLVVRERPARTPLLILFLGSTIGNFDPREQREFLAAARALLREGDALLLGADLDKPVEQLLAAYDDALGVTAAFDLNLLARINRELGGRFDLRSFRHEARWSREWSRVEMHLCSLRDQVVAIPGAGCRVVLREGETIWTESSHKFDAAKLPGLAASAGWVEVARWVDAAWPFADALWVVTSSRTTRSRADAPIRRPAGHRLPRDRAVPRACPSAGRRPAHVPE
jgi:dimethylhistidine N-methyltransferase